MQRCLLLVILLFSGLAAAQPIQLTTGEWPPFHGEQLPNQGVATRIVSEAFALEGIEVQWQFLPWARALQLAAQGQRNGTAVWRRNPERERLFLFSEPILTTQNHLFHRKQLDFDWQTPADLRGLRLGATRGYFYGQAFEQAEAAGLLNVQRINSDEVAFRQLLGGANRPVPPVQSGRIAPAVRALHGGGAGALELSPKTPEQPQAVPIAVTSGARQRGADPTLQSRPRAPEGQRQGGQVFARGAATAQPAPLISRARPQIPPAPAAPAAVPDAG
ncbi:substrate-binding periplasmic protein [Pseudomonas sp.]|uniref:substrate-binding periplasmic protein n=1 Tax=Pseudomonas sp. TaxID=306 RepID=UPI0035651A51